jgi:hypothetical protein
MAESPKSKIDSSIIAALIGVLGTITVTLISIFANRSAPPPATITPTATAAQLVVEIPNSSPGVESTVKYPDGKLFKLFYDDNSLYLLNLSDTAIPINRVAFERLSDQDVPLNRFNGTSWAAFYPDSKPGKCVALEILGSPSYLDPPECGRDRFLSLRTPTRDDSSIFWTEQEGSHQFRVLWRSGGKDEEIGRCEIGAGTCELLLP